MAESYSKRRIIKLDDVRQNNIVLVDLSKNLPESIFAQEYKKASTIIRSIISKSDDKSEKLDCCHPLKNAGFHAYNTDSYYFTRFQTAVPFIGERGTGKTSIMCSVLERLRWYHGDNQNAIFDLGHENDRTRFIAFDMIDANTLRSSEDIMEIILSRMLTYLEEMHSDNDFRELYRQIDELHKDLGMVYWKKEGTRSECGLTTLQRIADSQKTIENFRKLVVQFTQDISKYCFHGNPCYLVIALDDIDMYQGAASGLSDRQFALLEHIYNYTRIPGLIVLMTYNELLLRRQCNNHFARIYYGKKNPVIESPSDQEEIEALTAQFISKLFPQESRIYLPNYLFVDSENQPMLYVKPTLEASGDSPNSGVIYPFHGDETPSAKEFMLRLVAYETGVYFDASGSKKHFFEPRNLREFGELFQVLQSMEAVYESSQEQETVRDRNRMQLLNYLYNQYALKHLSSKEYRQFCKLSMLPIARQGRTLIDMVRQHRTYLNFQEDAVGYLSKTTQDLWKYSYGELLYNLYLSTRIPKEKKFDGFCFFSKEFVHCILGTHSVILNQLIRHPDSGEAMVSVIGTSISGQWANGMLPQFSLEKGDTALAAGSVCVPVRYFFDWEVLDEIQNVILNLHRNNGRSAQKVLSQYLEALIVIGMFFTGFPSSGLKITMVPEIDEQGAPTLYLRSSSEDYINFNVMNFVVNLLPGSEKNNRYLDYIQDKLRKLGREIAAQVNRNWAEIKQTAEKELEKMSTERRTKNFLSVSDLRSGKGLQEAQQERIIRWADTWMSMQEGYQFNNEAFIRNWSALVDKTCKKMQKEINAWQDKYSQFSTVLPVQHFDMMYNIIKRLADGSYYDIPMEAPVEEVYHYVVRLYQNVLTELGKQDQLYFHENQHTFSDVFRESAFYRLVAEETTRNPYVEQIYIAMMQKVLFGNARRISRTGLNNSTNT